MKVIISAGGTGGHIYPALAIINKIKDLEPNSDILYIGTKDRMEKDIVPKLNINYIGLDMEGLNRKIPLRNIIVLKKYLKAYNESKKIIKEFKPDVVVGVGGYITSPVLNAASKLKCKTVIHEQNSIPGVTNKMLSTKVDKILISMKNSIDYFPKEKVVYTGNPRSEEIIRVKKVTKKELGFDNKKLVVIVMGSLGSASINNEELEIVPNFKNKDYNVLLITGKRYYDDYKDIEIPSNVKVSPFENNLIGILKSTDLLVTRSGASTIAEITAIGVPSILVPSPYVTNNHQYKNAKELENSGAGIILEEKDFNSKNLLKEIDKLLNNDKILEEMKLSSKKLGVEDSATRVYNEIKKDIGEK